MNFYSVAMDDVRFLAKFDLTARTSYKTCLYCFTIKVLYFFNIIICTSGVNIHAVITCMLDKNTCIYKHNRLQKLHLAFCHRGVGEHTLPEAVCPCLGDSPPPEIWSKNSRKISITKEICITIDFAPLPPKKFLEESQTWL